MKRTVFLFLVVIFGITANAQDDNSVQRNEYRTLFGGNRITSGGYGGLSINYSQLDGRDALLIGIRGAWVINHGVGIGIAGYGITNDIKTEVTSDGTQFQLAGGYGGLMIEPIIGAKSAIHLAIPVLIGAGGIAYINTPWAPGGPNYENAYTVDSDAFFVFEPGLEIELSMVKFFRIALGVHYRYTSNVSLSYYTWDETNNNYDLITDTPDLKGFSYGITLKFGSF